MKILKLWVLVYIITSFILVIMFNLSNKYGNNLLYEMLKGNILGALFWSILLKKMIYKLK